MRMSGHIWAGRGGWRGGTKALALRRVDKSRREVGEAASRCRASGEREEDAVPTRSGTAGLITHQF